MTNLGRRYGVSSHSLAVSPMSSSDCLGRVRRRASEVERDLIPRFRDYVETRYLRNTLDHEPTPDRETAKQAILDKLDQIRQRVRSAVQERCPAGLDPVTELLRELAEACHAGGLPLGGSHALGQRLSSLLEHELVWLVDKLKSFR